MTTVLADIDLRKYGYAPGDYYFLCHAGCGDDSCMGDKRSMACRSCAIELYAADLEKQVTKYEKYQAALKPIHEFLLGIKPLDGSWFGEVQKYYWRHDLYRAIEILDENTGITVTYSKD